MDNKLDSFGTTRVGEEVGGKDRIQGAFPDGLFRLLSPLLVAPTERAEAEYGGYVWLAQPFSVQRLEATAAELTYRRFRYLEAIVGSLWVHPGSS